MKPIRCSSTGRSHRTIAISVPDIASDDTLARYANTGHRIGEAAPWPRPPSAQSATLQRLFPTVATRPSFLGSPPKPESRDVSGWRRK
eukprot:225729-Rhodomonas_salina.9